uniref:Uncharacterized protein n=1 Tax=Chelonoidis abingdonii TaxID=106734 RepID=A0A8C0GVC6_CHEAB
MTYSPTPKLVFNRVNGKRPLVTTQPSAATEESYTLAHEENVRFVYEKQQLDRSQPGESGRGPVQYTEKTPNPLLTSKCPGATCRGRHIPRHRMHAGEEALCAG